MTGCLEVNTHTRDGDPWPVIISGHAKVLCEDAPESSLCPHSVYMIMAGYDQSIKYYEHEKHAERKQTFLFFYFEDIE